MSFFFFFFFQAEDGIRDATVTGVQTCALPILGGVPRPRLKAERCRERKVPLDVVDGILHRLDRKSTRLNSSHGSISYAVFCLKKKNRTSTRSDHITFRCRSR